MTKSAGWGWVILAGLLSGVPISAQVLGNQTLSGKYYFRHISFGTDGRNPGSLTDARTLMGSITFDGAGHYAYIGQQLIATSAAVSQTGSGGYLLDQGGFLSLDSPLRTGAKINARFGAEAVIGSSTESTDSTFDLFVAIPAPSGGAVFAGPYNCMSLDFRAGVYALIRSTQFPMNQSSPGILRSFPVFGHAAGIALGTPLTQQVTGATYTMGADGVGTLNVGADDNAQLLSGSRTLYLSASGNILLGGYTAAGGHGITIGVKPLSGASNSTWNATYWGAGLRVDSSAVSGYSGALAARGQGKLTWSKRFKTLLVGAFDFTGINSYTLGADGAGTSDFTQVALGAGGKAFAGAAINANDPGAYEIYFGVQTPALTGTGVFLNPLGVLNAASSAPAGNPISPGEFVTLYGTGMAKSPQTATPPYPSSLNGVSVLINNLPAPLYFVSPSQINVLVPFATTGPTATIVVNNGVNSNTVTVPVAATSPGIFTLDQSGSGGGAIRHADFSLVNAASPAIGGETVLIYLTGLGTVTPPVADGTAGTGTALHTADADLVVYVGGQQATVLFKGLAPGFPGLYQLNVTLPQFLKASGNLPLAIQTLNAYHDQVDIPIL
jgi:uncharacterized protein (TIGR03437 family)